MDVIENNLIRGALVLLGKAPVTGTHIVKEQLYGYIKATNFAHQFGAYDEIYKIWDASLNLDLEMERKEILEDPGYDAWTLDYHRESTVTMDKDTLWREIYDEPK